jgi:hypothetical protein
MQTNTAPHHSSVEAFGKQMAKASTLEEAIKFGDTKSSRNKLILQT